MPYKMRFEEVLMPGWEAWNTGNYDIPGKNVTLENGKNGCVLISEDGASVYSKPLEIVNEEDMGVFFEAHHNLSNGEGDDLNTFIDKQTLSEVEAVFEKYQKHQASYEK